MVSAFPTNERSFGGNGHGPSVSCAKGTSFIVYHVGSIVDFSINNNLFEP
jgi:hypothetical protein